MVFDSKEAQKARLELKALRDLAKKTENRKNPDKRAASIMNDAADRMERLISLLERNDVQSKGPTTDHLPLRLV